MADNKFLESEIDTVLIKVASRCNINCAYCYVYNMGDDNWTRMPKFVDDETIDAICDSLADLSLYQKRHFSIVLHGGEPLLLGPKRLRHLLGSLRRALPGTYPVSIQTNGILISNEILDICSEYRASIAISIDGPEHIHDKLRKSHTGEGTFDKAIAGIEMINKHPDNAFLYAGLLAVIDPHSDPLEVYSFFKEVSPPSVDFLYKDGNHDHLPTGKKSIDSNEYGEWMSTLFDAYLKDETPIPIRVIDDMLKVLLGGVVSKEGLGVTDFGIIIIDTDGTIMKNDTLKSSFNGADKFENQVNIRERSLIKFINSTAFFKYREMQQPICAKCKKCSQLQICGGGMILHRWSKENLFSNPSVYCSDQMYLINYMRNTLNKVLTTYA